MNEITLNLTIDEINTIIESLGQQPFVKVYKLIEKIHLQANKELKENIGNPNYNKK